ncbi:hypothetical protein ACIO87_23230 [Streptomyces sp. NPDC087218]
MSDNAVESAAFEPGEIEIEEITESAARSCLGTIGTRFCYEA